MKVVLNNSIIDNVVIDTNDVVVTQTMSVEPTEETKYYKVGDIEFFVTHTFDYTCNNHYELNDIDGNGLCVAHENGEYLDIDDFVAALPEQPCARIKCYGIVTLREGERELPSTLVPTFTTLDEAIEELMQKAEAYADDNLPEDQQEEFLKATRNSGCYNDDVWNIFICAETSDGDVERVIL